MAWFRRKSATKERDWPRRVGHPVMSEGDVIGLWCPGFAPFTTSRLVINRNGVLRQEIQTVRFDGGCASEEMQEKTAQLAAEQLRDIISTAERIGFRSFRDCYDVSVTHLEDVWIAVRLSDGLKAVEAYGAILQAGRKSNSDMIGFVELWACINRVAPFPARYSLEELVESEARLWALIKEEFGFG